MKRLLLYLTLVVFLFSSCDSFGYGKYGRCKADTKSGSRCKSNAGKTGYCGTHK